MSALCHKQTSSPLFDQLVGTNEEWQRHFEAKPFGRLKIHKQIDLGGQFYRKVSRLGAFENLAYVQWSPLIHVQIVWAVCHQSAIPRCRWKTKYRSQAILEGGIDDVTAFPVSERTRLNNDRGRAIQLECRNGLADFAAFGYSSCPQFYAG